MARWSRSRDAEPAVVLPHLDAPRGHWRQPLAVEDMNAVTERLDRVEAWARQTVPVERRSFVLDEIEHARAIWVELVAECFPGPRRALRHSIGSTTPSSWAGRYLEDAWVACASAVDFAGRVAFDSVRAAAHEVDAAF